MNKITYATCQKCGKAAEFEVSKGHAVVKATNEPADYQSTECPECGYITVFTATTARLKHQLAKQGAARKQSRGKRRLADTILAELTVVSSLLEDQLNKEKRERNDL
nr:MAG TPA: nucleic-acid-binding protein [Caudoviricetes sp.]